MSGRPHDPVGCSCVVTSLPVNRWKLVDSRMLRVPPAKALDLKISRPTPSVDCSVQREQFSFCGTIAHSLNDRPTPNLPDFLARRFHTYKLFCIVIPKPSMFARAAVVTLTAILCMLTEWRTELIVQRRLIPDSGDINAILHLIRYRYQSLPLPGTARSVKIPVV